MVTVIQTNDNHGYSNTNMTIMVAVMQTKDNHGYSNTNKRQSWLQ